MSTQARSPGGTTTSSGFSNFLPRFRKESSAPPPGSSPPDRSPSLSPTKFLASEPSSASSARRLSLSRNRRDLSPSPTSTSSQTISPRSSLTSLGAYARQQGPLNGSAEPSAAVKSTVSPPKLTLTTNDGDGGSSAQSIFIPSPIDPSSPSLFGYGQPGTEDALKTPTAGIHGDDRDFQVGSGSLTLDDVPGGVAHHLERERSTTPRPPSPRKDSNASSSAASSSYGGGPNGGGSSSRRSSYHQQFATEPSLSSASLAAPPRSPSPSLAPSDKSSRRKRGLSASSFSRKPKPAQGIAGALAGMSKDLVNPAAGLVQDKNGGGGDRGRPRGDTGESYGSRGSAGSSSKKAAKKDKDKDKRKSAASTRAEEVYENGVSRTRASSISYLSSTDGGTSSPSAYADHRASPAISQRELSAALSDAADGRSEFGEGASAYSDDDDDGNGGGGGGGGGGGLGLLDDSDDDLEGLPDDGDDYDVDDLPVTGFAVASVKRNADFHALFDNAVPEDDYLIEDYGCALQREILLQGRLYVSENHICFHANIFGWVTNLVLPFSEMVRIDKKMTALIIPNAIQISTLHAKHTFASFLSRDTTYDVIHNIWRLSHPHLPSSHGAPSESGSTRQSQGDSISTDDVLRSASPAAAAAAAAAARRQPTSCACLRKGEHYPEIAMDAVFPSAPEKIYNLIFTSGFAKDFLVNDQRLMELQISDWKPQDASSSNMLVRSMSYIKPLAGGFGPKQTKCELKDETDHVDFDDYVSMLTTTRTPDVPSGGVFSVKTRTCLMWAGANSTRVLVSTKVEWTGRSFIKGIIESSALAGQKEFHSALERAMRAYITEHLTEFHVEGVDECDDAGAPAGADGGPSSPAVGAGPTHAGGGGGAFDGGSAEAQAAKKKAEQEGLVFQYGIDTLGKGAVEILKGGWAIVESACGMLSVHAVLALVIAVLVASNLWTLVSLKGSQSSAARVAQANRVAARLPRAPSQAPYRQAGAHESPDSVADAVKTFLEEYMHRSAEQAAQPEPAPADEVAALAATLDALEARIGRLRARLPPSAAETTLPVRPLEGAQAVLDGVD